MKKSPSQKDSADSRSYDWWFYFEDREDAEASDPRRLDSFGSFRQNDGKYQPQDVVDNKRGEVLVQ